MPYIEDREVPDPVNPNHVFIVEYKAVGQVAGYELPHWRVKLSGGVVVDIRA